MDWAYGVITVPERQQLLLPTTLLSLCKAGFPSPQLFFDGHQSEVFPWRNMEFPLHATGRGPRIGNFGNWLLGLSELYLRNPKADRYAIFEDDIVLCKNVRQYIERSKLPNNCYLNLYTTNDNEDVELSRNSRWGPSQQVWRGALALVFSRDVVKTLLGSKRMWEHAEDRHRGHYLVDGTVGRTLQKAGIKEWVHYPSLAQHTGTDGTTIPNRLSPTLDRWQTAPSFPGEDHDAMEFLK